MQTDPAYTIRAQIEPGGLVGSPIGPFRTEREAIRHLSRITDPTYEGWSNRETWAVNLWLSNDEGLYNDVRRMAALALDDTEHDVAVAELSDELRPYVEELVLGDDPGANLATDLLTGALGRVDWGEIAEGWISGEE